jgi:hypothetical protein
VSAAECRVYLLERQAGRIGELLRRRLAGKLDLESPCRPGNLLAAFDHVHWQADRPGVIADRSLDGLADPPGRIRRELQAPPPVELLRRPVEAERALLDEVEEGNAEATVRLCDRDHQTEVRLDHVLLGDRIASLDPLGKRLFLRRRQQLAATDVRKKELQRVRVALSRGEVFGHASRLGGRSRPRIGGSAEARSVLSPQ